MQFWVSWKEENVEEEELVPHEEHEFASMESALARFNELVALNVWEVNLHAF